MTLKEQNIILGRLDKLQATVDYNNNLYRQTEDDIIDSIKVLVSLAKIMFGWQNGDSTNGNA